MNLLSAIVSNASDARRGGIALCSALLAAPVLIVAHPGAGATLLALAVVTVAAVLEGRARGAARSLEATRPRLTLVSMPSRRPPSHGPRARWEVVERDGQRSLSMRWR